MPEENDIEILDSMVRINVSLFSTNKNTIKKFKKSLESQGIKLIREESTFMESETIFSLELNEHQRIITPCACEITLINPKIRIEVWNDNFPEKYKIDRKLKFKGD